MVEIYNVSGGVDKPIPVITGPLVSTSVLDFPESSHVIIDGDLDVGSAVTPIATDAPLITVQRFATVIVKGKLSLYRDVDAASPLALIDSSAKLLVTGGADLVRDGVGAGGVFRVAVDSLLKIIGTTDLLSFEGVPTADGSFVFADRDSVVWLDQVLFNSGGDLAMGAFATVWMDRHARLHVVDVTGGSDALNTSNPGAPACTGVMLSAGAQAHLPPWQLNTGIASDGVAANGRDQKVGAAAVGNWGGSETLVDAGELCLAYKP